MLTLQRAGEASIISVPTTDESISNLLDKEWLLTNDRGGYSSSTIVGCNTRRYHGLLIGSLNPPVNRIVALSNCLEMLIYDKDVINLSTFEFDDKFAPQGFSHIGQFRRDTGVHFDFELDKLKLTKSIYLLRDSDTVAIVYDFRDVKESVEFTVRPFVGLRDFHTLQGSYAPLFAQWRDDGLLVRHNAPGSCELFLKCPGADFEKDRHWWFNFLYRRDKQRGQAFTEDLWTPGFFKCRIDSSTKIVLWANVSDHYESRCLKKASVKAVCKDLRKHQRNILAAAKPADENLEKLYLAAEQFVAKRESDHEQRTTILAGFPWFADWGRDAFISLPGLLLCGGRFSEAKSVLTTFAQAADDGLIPNRFDDRSSTAHFNSVDASVWFINAAFQYLEISGDSRTFTDQLLPIIRCIVDSFQKGNKFGIHADVDGLITGGAEETQLTWMDAKYNGIAFTPRYGKAVEVNALWYNSLCQLRQFYTKRDVELAQYYGSMAGKVKHNFCRLFWNVMEGYLNDCIFPDGSVDATCRPNQIFAVSLPFSPLPAPQQKKVVAVVRKRLLTPFGLRTLDVGDSRYKGTYTGPQHQRDEAYHQGTVWPYLIGPFVESYLKVNDFSKESKDRCAEFIRPLIEHLTADGCLGQISEIFDGDSPHKPKGCIAQAWSVGELIRAYRLINS